MCEGPIETGREQPGGITVTSWLTSDSHHRWLQFEEDRLVSFFARHAFGPGVGFSPLGADGEPDLDAPRELWLTSRMIHCFCLESIRGRPGAFDIAERGMTALREHFADDLHGGWYTSVNPDGSPADRSKSAYGHAFVVLAASSAVQAGVGGGTELLAQVLRVIDDHFWDPEAEASFDAFHEDWTLIEPGYRGQNANMHLVEVYMAAYEATRDAGLVAKAVAIAERIVNVNARAWDWRVPEHFDERWQVLPDYGADRPADQFRPFGVLVGHWFEWARLVLQLERLSPEAMEWAVSAARALFQRGVSDGWDPASGGVIYSVDFHGEPLNTHRMHWVQAEGVGAAVALAQRLDDPVYETWYRRFWNYIARYIIDTEQGGWWHELGADGKPSADTWAGKPDLYHALQATLYARSDPTMSLVLGARQGWQR